MKNLNILFSVAVGLLTAINVWASPAITVEGVAPMMTTVSSGAGVTNITSAKLSYGGGVLFDTMMGGSTVFTVGVEYAPRAFTIASATDTFPFLNLPVTLGFRLGSAGIIDVGGFYSIAMGSVSDNTGATATFAAAGFNSSDYGLRGGLRFLLPLGSTHLSLGAHYNFGLAEAYTAPTTGVTTHWSGFEFSAGLRFGGGGK